MRNHDVVVSREYRKRDVKGYERSASTTRRQAGHSRQPDFRDLERFEVLSTVWRLPKALQGRQEHRYWSVVESCRRRDKRSARVQVVTPQGSRWPTRRCRAAAASSPRWRIFSLTGRESILYKYRKSSLVSSLAVDEGQHARHLF